MHGQMLQSILDNYKELMELWEWSLSVVSETEMKVCIRGVQSFMGKFGFLFDCHLGKLLLSQTENLSKTIQKPETSAVEAQSLAKSILSVLVSDRSVKAFSSFGRVLLSKIDLDVDDAQVSTKRKVPSRFESSKQESYHYNENPENKHKRIYYEAFDRVIACIRERFDQKGY